MAHRLKNLSAIPLDVATLNGPSILPANGELPSVELSAFEAEVMRQSPDIEITDVVDPLDHDEDGKKGGAKKPPVKSKKAR